jgi:hypothetical protein
VAAWIQNDEAKTNPLDYDNEDKNGSNGMDHHVDTSGNLRIHASVNFNGPIAAPEYIGDVGYSLVAVRKDVWGVKWFGWDEATDSACESSSTVSADGIIDKNHAFVVPYSLGVNSSQDETREFDRVYNYVKLEEVDATAGTAKVVMNGCIKGHKGILETDEKFHLNANQTKGHLIYCKDSSICQTVQGHTTETEGEGEGSTGDTHDTGLIEVNF